MDAPDPSVGTLFEDSVTKPYATPRLDIERSWVQMNYGEFEAFAHAGMAAFTSDGTEFEPFLQAGMKTFNKEESPQDSVRARAQALPPITVVQDSDGNEWGFHDNEDGTCTLCSGVLAPNEAQGSDDDTAGKERVLIIPDKLEGLSVVYIGTEAFARSSGFKEAIIPPSVIAIGPQAFAHCTDLESCRFSEGLQIILEQAFMGSGLRSLHTPHSLERIERGAFSHCKELSDVKLASGLEHIGTKAFRDCPKLTSIVLPETLISLSNFVFEETGLRTITLPASLREMGDSAFILHSGSRSLKGDPPLLIRVDEGNPKFFIRGGVLCARYESGERAIVYAGEASTVEIPRSVTSLGYSLLYGFEGIDELRIHDGLQEFEPRALGAANVIPHVHIDMVEPLDGVDELDLFFASEKFTRHSFISLFIEGRFNYEKLIGQSDMGLTYVKDKFELGRAVLHRLAQPLFIDDETEAYLRGLIDGSLDEVSREFARHNYNDGFRMMADQGVLTSENYDRVLEGARKAEGVSSVGYLLSLRRERFDFSFADEYSI